MPITAKIDRITPVRGGSGLSLALTVTDGEHEESRTVLISTEDYAGMRFLHPYEKAVGRVLDGDRMEELDEAAETFSAIEKGLYLLSYGDATEAALVRKLRERGFSACRAASAARQLAARGYIDEDAQIERFLRVALRKGWGPRRILAAAREKRYAEAALSHLQDLLAEIDFCALCAIVIEKKWGSLPADRAAADKAIASLIRFGYSMNQIQAAKKGCH